MYLQMFLVVLYTSVLFEYNSLPPPPPKNKKKKKQKKILKEN